VELTGGTTVELAGRAAGSSLGGGLGVSLMRPGYDDDSGPGRLCALKNQLSNL
jgi:hypothetical protein